MASNPSLSQIPGGLMADHAGIALLAGHDPPTSLVGAGDVVGVPASVQQEKHLSIVMERAGDRVPQSRSDQTDSRLNRLATLFREVHDLDRRKLKTRCSVGQSMECMSIGGGGVVPALKGWRGRTQDHRTSGQLGPTDRAVPTVVPRGLILLVGRIMLFIDDHQAELCVGNGCEEGGSGP